jgi:hypothetical protein
MQASIFLTLVAAIGFQPGPSDAFRINKESIKARVDYEYHEGFPSKDFKSGDQLWSPSRPTFIPRPYKSLTGQWDSDGRVDRYEVHPDPAEWAKRTRPPIGAKVGVGLIPNECLFDGETFAHHDFAMYPGAPDLPLLNVLQQRQPAMAEDIGWGPFHWAGIFPLQEILATRFRGVTPERKTAVRGGHPTEVEVYQIPQPDNGSYRLQICYDPSIGYLPRYTRGVSHYHGKTFIVENFVVNAMPCKEGGFIPMEWFTLSYDIEDFERNYPDYNDNSELLKGRTRFNAGHFRASKMVDRDAPVALEHVGMIRAIGGQGNFVTLKAPPESFTLEQIKQILGPPKPNMATTLPPLMATANDEMKMYPNRPSEPAMSWTPILGAIGAILAAVLAFAWAYHARKRKNAIVALLLVSAGSFGCSGRVEPAVELRAALEGSFRQNLLVYPSKA